MDAPDSVAIITAVSTLAGIGLALLVLRVIRPRDLISEVGPAAALKFAEGERDRMHTVAKGMAASSGGFLAAVLTALIKGEVTHQLTPLTLVLVLLGSVGMLLLAAAQSRVSAIFMAATVSSYAAVSRADYHSRTEDTLEW